MIKVLRIINRFNLGGPTYNATYLSAYLPQEFETKLVGGSHEEGEGSSTFILDKHGVKFEYIQHLQREVSLSADRKAYQEIRELIKEYQPDIVHTHAAKAGFIGRLAAHKEQVPVIVHTFHGHVFHSYFGRLKTNLFKSLERLAAKRSDAIIAISERQLEELAHEHKIAPREKFRVIPLGFELDRFRVNRDERRSTFRQEWKIDADTLAIGIIGRLTAIKNHELFMRAVAQVAKESKQSIHALIIGDGELREELQKLADELENNSGKRLFTFTSWIRSIDFALPGLDLVGLSSLNEGTPVSLIEAQAAGVPVVTTNVGGVKNVVNDGVTGIIVNSFDLEDYAKALLTLVESEEKRDEMSQNGWNHVKKKYHYKRLCQDVSELYTELLNKKGVRK